MGREPHAVNAWNANLAHVDHAIIRVTIEAGEIMTAEQWAAVGQMTGRNDVHVVKGGFDLPAGYVMFHQVDGLTGGIAPDGSVST